jgi:ABC-type branched-subunit amino acid transport system substrate-binding protein
MLPFSRFFLPVCLALYPTVFPGPARAATPYEQASAILAQVQDDLRNGRWATARLKAQTIVTRYTPYQDLTEQAYLLLGITLYRLGDFPSAEWQFDYFIRNYPQSAWRDQAKYFWGKTLFRRGERERSRVFLADLAGHVTDEQLQQRIQRHFPAPAATSTLTKLAAWITSAGAPADRRAARVGLLCPLTGEQSANGEALLRGATVAITEHNRASNCQVQLVVEDTQERQLTAIAGTQRLISDERVLGLVGPLTSSTTITVGLLAQEHRVSLVAPTATEHGIAGMGDCLVQLNVPTEVQGELVAEFAMQQLQHSTFAILSPRDEYGQAMTRGFERKVQELGGTVVAREWYYEGTADFSSQFKKIRRRELIKALNLMNVVDGTDVEKMALAKLRDKEREPDKEKDKKRDEDGWLVPIRSIDAFFVPAYADEAPLVASQIAFNKLDARILGGDKWNDEGVLKEKTYVEGAVFPALVRRDRQAQADQAFSKIYNETYKDTPGDLVLLGYDGVRFMLAGAGQEGATREKVRETLRAVREFDGVGRKLVFPAPEHYNRYLDFSMVKNGKIVPYAPGK